MDILVTGAGGQLGSEVARLGEAQGLNIVALTRHDLDISKPEAVEAAVEYFRPKVVVNAAAYTAVDKAETDEAAVYSVNRDGPSYLAKVAGKIGAALIHISTDYVFDGTKAGGYTEDDPVTPIGVYGQSKEAGERAVREIIERHIVLRTAWVFDEQGDNFVKTMLQVGAERDELRVVDDQIGCPTYAADLADAVLTLAGRIARGNFSESGYGTFHCTGRGQTSWCGFARRIFKIAEPRMQKIPNVVAIPSSEYPTVARRPANSVLDCGKMELVHGIRLRTWQSALTDMLSRLNKSGRCKLV